MPKTLVLPSFPEQVTETIRNSATQYFMMNSADRNQNAVPGSFADNSAPWNKFQIQRPQALMEAFARRIKVSDIRFPWYIPNITAYNNTLWFQINGAPNPIYSITLPPKFYTPSTLVSAINSSFVAQVPTNPPVLSYDASSYTYTLTVSGGNNVIIWDVNPATNPVLPNPRFYSQASLFKTLGFYPVQAGRLVLTSLTGGITTSSYTDYVDICSDKLMYFTDVKDSSSSNTATNPSVVCRVFATTEVSLPDNPEGTPLTSTPFVIYRQFRNAKNIKWNPESHLDWLDISVLDQYGNLIPLPSFTAPGLSGSQEGAYPDFQITFLASEN
jgi:hypothetical protein